MRRARARGVKGEGIKFKKTECDLPLKFGSFFWRWGQNGEGKVRDLQILM